MNYIYDILTNFHSNLYDFYEWNPTDEITHIRKVPLFYIPQTQLAELVNHDIIMDKTFLDIIRYKTEVFTNKKIETLEYSCLFSDGMEVIAVRFDQNGKLTGKSKLLTDESDEVMEVCGALEHTPLTYQILSSKTPELFRTRKETEIKKYILKEINKLDHENDLEKLKYLYYECFLEKEEDKTKITARIKRELKNNWNQYNHEIYQFLKLTSIRK